MTTTQRVIREADIVAARLRVAAAEAAGEQCDFKDAILASADLTPSMIHEWVGALVHVNWCACAERPTTPAEIVCPACGLPPYWKSIEEATA